MYNWAGSRFRNRGSGDTGSNGVFPRSIERYGDQNLNSIPAVLWNRIQAEPFNLAATLIFFCAVYFEAVREHVKASLVAEYLLRVTAHFQNGINLKPPLLMGFSRGAGGPRWVQGRWIEPLLGNLSEIFLMLGATLLTAQRQYGHQFSHHPGAGLHRQTQICRGGRRGTYDHRQCVQPVRQVHSQISFENGVSPMVLLKGELAPTVIVWPCFVAIR